MDFENKQHHISVLYLKKQSKMLLGNMQKHQSHIRLAKNKVKQMTIFTSLSHIEANQNGRK